MNFNDTIKYLGNVNKAVYGVNPYKKECDRCHGEGVVYVPNGQDDYDKEVCDCQDEI